MVSNQDLLCLSVREWYLIKVFSVCFRYRNLTAVGSSLARVTCETSQVLLACGQVVFLGISHFYPTLRLTRLKMSEIILTGHKTKKNKINTGISIQINEDIK